jgi:hypothetical protein
MPALSRKVLRERLAGMSNLDAFLDDLLACSPWKTDVLRAYLGKVALAGSFRDQEILERYAAEIGLGALIYRQPQRGGM